MSCRVRLPCLQRCLDASVPAYGSLNGGGWSAYDCAERKTACRFASRSRLEVAGCVLLVLAGRVRAIALFISAAKGISVMSWVLRTCAFPLPSIRVFALPSRYYVQKGLLFSGKARNAACMKLVLRRGLLDIKLNSREQGDGYPLILLHGNGEDSSCFRHQLEYFSKEYRVIAIDTRGQGESPSWYRSFYLRAVCARPGRFHG